MKELDIEYQSEEEPAQTAKEYVIHSDDDIVQPVLDIPQKKKRIYKPRIRKDSVQQPEAIQEPIEIPEKILKEIEILQNPIVELDERPDPPEPEPEKPKEKKKEPLVTCPHCSKEMLKKTFKYYHSLKCKEEAIEAEAPVTQPREPKEESKAEVIEEPKPPPPLPSTTSRHVQRREFFKSLVKNAF